MSHKISRKMSKTEFDKEQQKFWNKKDLSLLPKKRKEFVENGRTRTENFRAHEG